MEKIKVQNPQFDYFLTNFGKLLESRIMRYQALNKGEVEFLNQFINVPLGGEIENEVVRWASAASNHFEDNLKISFVKPDLCGLSLTENKDICYSFYLAIPFFGDDPCYVQLIGDEIVDFSSLDNEALELLDNETWEAINLQLNQEISFGTLSLR